MGRVFKDMFKEPSERNILSKTSPHWSEERKRKVTPLGNSVTGPGNTHYTAVSLKPVQTPASSQR